MKNVRRIVCLAMMAVLLLCLAPDTAAFAAASEAPAFPFTAEPVTLTVMVPQTSVIEDWETNKMTLYIEEKTGIPACMLCCHRRRRKLPAHGDGQDHDETRRNAGSCEDDPRL